MRSSLLNKRTLTTGLAALSLAALLSTEAKAQLTLTGTSYTQDFNNIAGGLPLGWTVRTGATATILGTDVTATKYIGTVGIGTEWAATSGTFKNAASATAFPFFASGTTTLQASETNRSLAVRQVGPTNASFPNSDSGAAFVLQIANTTGLTNFNLSFKLQSLDSASTRVTTWKVDYGFGSTPASFTPATATGTVTTGGNTYGNHTVSVNFGTSLDNQAGPVFIRIVALTSSTGTLNRATTGIDDYSLTWTGAGSATHIQMISKTPTGTNVPLATDTLHIKYDNPLALGTGNVQLYKTPSTLVGTFNVATAATINADSSVTINGVTLENNTSYYVNVDAGAFTKNGGTLPNEAVTGNTAWTFKTVDTTSTPPPAPMTTLNESFVGCTPAAMGVFVQYSKVGDKTWRCSKFSHTADSAAVYINAGSNSGAEASNDWLISKAPFNFSAMTSPELSFWQKRRFNGNVTRTLKVSSNYVAGTDPTLPAYTWTPIATTAMANKPGTTWEQVNGIDLTPYKSGNFYLAFTYECGVDSAYELTYDDIKVAEKINNGIFSASRGQINIQVLGDATPAAINLGISLEKAANLEAQIFDLTGRKVYSQSLKTSNGKGVYTLNNTNLIPGMYVIRITNGAESGTIKALVR